MPSNGADPTTLRLKLEEAHAAIQTVERGLSAARNRTEVGLILGIEQVAEALVRFRDGLAAVAEQGFALSLIGPDLDAQRETEGTVSAADARGVFQILATRFAELMSREAPLTVDDVVNLVQWGEDFLVMVLDGLLKLRDRYQGELAASAQQRTDRTPRELTQLRDVRIRQLRRAHPQATWNEFVEIAAADPRVLATGQRVSRSIVQKAVKPQKPKAKDSRSQDRSAHAKADKQSGRPRTPPRSR